MSKATSVGKGAWHPLVDGVPPKWASTWGQDRFGVFASFEVGGVESRMRWIPPGSQVLGSPPDEPGRRKGMEERVEIGLDGFWIAEFPCTQELFDAVLGEGMHISRFRHPKRPVDSVS